MKHKNIINTLTGGTTMTEVALSLDEEDNTVQFAPLTKLVSAPMSNILEGVENEEEAVAIVPQTPKKRAKKRASVSGGVTGVVTPKKTKISPAKAKPSGENDAEASGEDVEMDSKIKKPRTPKTPKTINAKSVTKSVARKRGPTKAAEGIAPGRTIPLSWDDATEADRKLVQMKEAGNSWVEIREMWKTETGQDTAGSTLPNRYSRIKVNLEHLEPGDEVLLFNALARYENEKWRTISAFMEAEGAKKYAGVFLQKEAKKIEDRQANGTYIPATTAMTTNENGNHTNNVAADTIHDLIHQNGAIQGEKVDTSGENVKNTVMAFKNEEEADDQDMDEI
ncbi:hypothetical protein MMC11_003564 [Xylographa trunciseda]|nr:hypothetical protein [Xylographa trunciseda]